MSVSARITELDIALPSVATPLAAYVPAIRSGFHIFTSGQLPVVDGVLPVTGKVGGGVSPEEATEAARVAALNAVAAAAATACGVDNLVRVVKATVFISSVPEFTGQPAVANGASNVLAQIFETAHARSAISVASLPLDAPVEVEVIFEAR